MFAAVAAMWAESENMGETVSKFQRTAIKIASKATHTSIPMMVARGGLLLKGRVGVVTQCTRELSYNV